MMMASCLNSIGLLFICCLFLSVSLTIGTKYKHAVTTFMLKVLESIPWDKVNIEVLTIESNHMGEIFPGSQIGLREFLEEKGYVLAYTVDIDDVFIKKELYEGKYKPDPKMIKKFELEYGSRCIWDTDATKVQFYRVVTEALRNKVLSSLALEKQMEFM